MRTTPDGKGVINCLELSAVAEKPKLFSTFLMWLLAELHEALPEVGDLDKPKLVFFFDEAHLLFEDASKEFLDQVAQTVRLIRLKGVGVFFVTQLPSDVPDVVLAQLGNRVQHALRAFTPRDQKAVHAAAQTFRQSPGLNVEDAITQLGVGEALVSFLDAKGMPEPVERALVLPPASRLGPVTSDERKKQITGSVLYGTYEKTVDRESAYEMLKAKAAQPAPASNAGSRRDSLPEPLPSSGGPPVRRGGREPDTMLEVMAKSALRAAGSQLGRQILRGVLGSMFTAPRR
jgi:DNA helicase HerA-like ATPase